MSATQVRLARAHPEAPVRTSPRGGDRTPLSHREVKATRLVKAQVGNGANAATTAPSIRIAIPTITSVISTRTLPPPRPREPRLGRPARIFPGAIDIPIDATRGADVVKPGGIVIRVKHGQRYAP